MSERWQLKPLRIYLIPIRYAVVIVIWILASLFSEHSVYYVISRSIYIYQMNCSKMVKVCKELTVDQKNVVINMHKERFLQRKIANILGVTQACICKVFKTR